MSNPGSLPAQDPCHPKIPVIPRSQSTQDPSQPKIPVIPRSQLALDAFMPIWLMPIWYLAHAIKFFKHILHTYLDFSHAYLAHLHFSQSKKPHEPRTCCNLFQISFSANTTDAHPKDQIFCEKFKNTHGQVDHSDKIE